MAVLQGFIKTQQVKIKAQANRALDSIVASINSSFGTNFDVNDFEITKTYYALRDKLTKVTVSIIAKDKNIKSTIIEKIKYEPKCFQVFLKEIDNFASRESSISSFTETEVIPDCYETPTYSRTVVSFYYEMK